MTVSPSLYLSVCLPFSVPLPPPPRPLFRLSLFLSTFFLLSLVLFKTYLSIGFIPPPLSLSTPLYQITCRFCFYSLRFLFLILCLIVYLSFAVFYLFEAFLLSFCISGSLLFLFSLSSVSLLVILVLHFSYLSLRVYLHFHTL